MKTSRYLFVALLIFGIAMGIGLPASHAQKMQCKDRFAALDANGDGKVTKEEFQAFKHPGMQPDQVFATVDKNNDGVLTEEEFCAFRGHGKGKGKMQQQGS